MPLKNGVQFSLREILIAMLVIAAALGAWRVGPMFDWAAVPILLVMSTSFVRQRWLRVLAITVAGAFTLLMFLAWLDGPPN